MARELGKPTILEEYGIKVGRTPDNRGEINQGWDERRATYQRWNDITLKRGGNAALPWMLAGIDEDKGLYPDYDRFVFYRSDATGKLIGDYAKAFQNAPACQVQAPSSAPASPFVSVTRPAQRVALGWLASQAI